MNHRHAVPAASGWASTIALLLGLSGCAAPSGPLSLSLTELGSEVQQDAGSKTDNLTHRRSINITGLGAADVIGGISVNPDPPLFNVRSLLSQASLPDQLALRFVPGGCSRVLVTNFSKPEDDAKLQEAVLTLRDSLQVQSTLAVQALRLQAESELAERILANFSAAVAAAGAASSASATLPPQDRDQRAALLNAWAVLSQRPAASDTAGWQKTVATIAGEQSEVSAKLVAAKAQANAARRMPGIVVTHWEYAARKEGGLQALGIGASASKSQTREGFAVLGGLKVMSLKAGDDLLAHLQEVAGGADSKGVLDLIPLDRRYTTTYQLLAKHVAWSDAGSVDQQAQLSLQLKQIVDVIKGLPGGALADLGGTLAALDVQVQVSSASHLEALNQGALSSPATIDPIPFSFLAVDYRPSIAKMHEVRKDHLVIVSMRSSLEAMGEGLRSKNDGRFKNACDYQKELKASMPASAPTSVSAKRS
jgi:hypothetical protein